MKSKLDNNFPSNKKLFSNKSASRDGGVYRREKWPINLSLEAYIFWFQREIVVFKC